MKTYQFYLPDFAEGPEDATEFEVFVGSENPSYIAECAAHEYYHENGGYTDKWPLRFTILSGTGDEIGTYKVHLKQKISFKAKDPT